MLQDTRPAWGQPPSSPPAASQELKDKVHDLVEDIYESEVELKVTQRRSKILKMKHDIFRAAVADPTMIDFVAFGTREIEIIGKTPGTTTLTLWLGTPEQTRMLSLLITVDHDTAVEDRRRMEYGELQNMINEMFPNSKIQLIPIADKLIMRGEARDEEESLRILSIVTQNLQGLGGGGFGGGNGGGGGLTTQGTAAEPFPDAGTLPTARVISMLKTPGEKQVMLKVRIAELKRSAVRTLATRFEIDLEDFLFSSAMTSGGNILTSGTFNDNTFNVMINALASNGTGKILAEPNLVVLSGQTATFLAGGEFAVPTTVGVGGAQAATTSFKGFGTMVTFTPTVIDNDRIRLAVAPTFSTLNRTNSVGGIFGTDTRTVQTVVEMREGQVLAIAGLLQEQQRGDVARVPLLGDIPLVNSLFQNKSISRDETELIVIVSPELVHPMEPENAPSILPGMEVTEPDDIEFFLYGHVEGLPGLNHRSTVWPLYRDRMKQVKKNRRFFDPSCPAGQSDSYYINSEHGCSK